MNEIKEEKEPLTENVIFNFSNIKGIIDTKEKENKIKIPENFKDYIYLCDEDEKNIYFL